MKKTKPIRIIIKDDHTQIYDFQLPSKTSAEDIITAIATQFKISLPEGIQHDSDHKDQLKFSFAA